MNINGSSPLWANSLSATLDNRRLSPSETSDTFAASIVNRIDTASISLEASTASANFEQNNQNNSSKQQPQLKADLGKLKDSLSSTIKYLADKYDSSTATAAMGIIYSKLGHGEVNEQTLGEALVSAAQFIDSNFGEAAGDDFIAYLNNNVNSSLNSIFDNGANEQFIVATTKSGSTTYSNGINTIDSSLAETLNQASVVTTILDSYKNNRDSISKNPYFLSSNQSPLYSGMLFEAYV